ncbi:MAG: UDP-N-acetylglucosamine--N-acetylmuramyl-(pentapeptide) pyrophosphoryl-undecaprenol N-acetylglucosamine transferase [Capsulimonadaceae bacterium]|nr:UDP-N-acetylglucosamine--N-acetylmuramyl-(pentapeptide) pyrophosphoryl-undecaprenol N-acetylglucosamine transferase [Capsulimonadaceae bacterium]
MDLRILITGGGTGGHAVPAIATAKAIRELALEDGTWKPVFLYVGSESGVEQKLAEEAGIDFEAIKTGKLRRSANPVRMINRANIADLARVPIGINQAARAVARFRPNVVFSTGGYVCVPAALAAQARRIPVVAHEQTVQIGLANKIVMPRAARIALSYPETAECLGPSQRARSVVTGNPVRTDGFMDGIAERAATWAGFVSADHDLPAIYITGGAKGSRVINVAVSECAGELLAHCRVIHQCGRQPGDQQDIDLLNATVVALPEELRSRYHAVEFVGPEIGDVYALADLIVARSGAGTVAEVCALGKAALFIPLVPTGGDEQRRNAQRLADAGAAAILAQDSLSGPALRDAIVKLLDHPAQLRRMGEAARTLARPHAARDLAKLVVETARAGR